MNRLIWSPNNASHMETIGSLLPKDYHHQPPRFSTSVISWKLQSSSVRIPIKPVIIISFSVKKNTSSSPSILSSFLTVRVVLSLSTHFTVTRSVYEFQQNSRMLGLDSNRNIISDDKSIWNHSYLLFLRYGIHTIWGITTFWQRKITRVDNHIIWLDLSWVTSNANGHEFSPKQLFGIGLLKAHLDFACKLTTLEQRTIGRDKIKFVHAKIKWLGFALLS